MSKKPSDLFGFVLRRCESMAECAFVYARNDGVLHVPIEDSEDTPATRVFGRTSGVRRDPQGWEQPVDPDHVIFRWLFKGVARTGYMRP